LKHGNRVPVKFPAHIRSAEPPGCPVDQANAQIVFKPLDAITECRFWNVETAAGSREPAPLNNLNKVENFFEVEHYFLLSANDIGRNVYERLQR
jgi:hypothetical protein